ncbi:hypothetical protein PGB34_14940 [Xenophilus arseniciresistens]|uniref:Uncharacterized protein n=1 Tax=Xenophilus arseniciresistens TaxID=1283306 RepID=A0AAE3NC70_9BURK|nr:hypothetical protein [Xenophilus arseniciresistens]MDA7417657.1 hypothetical protein [Xenophilus arseniciresistens]
MGLVLLLAPAWAQVARLDDSTSPRAHVSVDLQQARPVDAHTLALPLGRIDYRLATTPHVGRRARIFYVVPPAIAGLRAPAGLQVQWRSLGVFASGAARPGDRVPVWQGIVRTGWMNESFDLQLRIDPRALQMGPGAALSFEAYFEIETMP